MPDKQSRSAIQPRYRARMKIDGEEYYLGTFDSYQKAKDREDKFRRIWKSRI